MKPDRTTSTGGSGPSMGLLRGLPGLGICHKILKRKVSRFKTSYFVQPYKYHKGSEQGPELYCCRLTDILAPQSYVGATVKIEKYTAFCGAYGRMRILMVGRLDGLIEKASRNETLSLHRGGCYGIATFHDCSTTLSNLKRGNKQSGILHQQEPKVNVIVKIRQVSRHSCIGLSANAGRGRHRLGR